MKLMSAATLACLSLFVVSHAEAAPQLFVEQPAFNFGKIIQGKKVDHTFMLQNTGDEPLQIKAVKPACGCTAAKVSSQTIAPGKKVELKTTFDSSNFSGAVKKTIAVETNDPKAPTYNLTLNASIMEEIEITPRQLSFGRIPLGTPTTLQFSISNRSGKPILLTGMKTSTPQASVKAGKTVLNPGDSSSVSVTVTPRESDRVISGYVTVTTDHPTKGSVTVPFYGSPVK